MTNKEEGKTQYIRRRLLEARSSEELEQICAELKADPEIADGSVEAEKSKLKKKGAFQFRPETTKAVTSNKPLPAEALINELQLPPMVDGTRHIFDAGVEYGMKSILIGVRVAQELSKMGIDQATPIIRMAQEMRQTEGQVARETGMAMGETLAGKIFDYFEQKLPQQKPDIAMTPDPMKGLMARTMETIVNQLTGMMFGGQVGLTPGLVDKRGQK
jgi:hypothetical protein